MLGAGVPGTGGVLGAGGCWDTGAGVLGAVLGVAGGGPVADTLPAPRSERGSGGQRFAGAPEELHGGLLLGLEGPLPALGGGRVHSLLLATQPGLGQAPAAHRWASAAGRSLCHFAWGPFQEAEGGRKTPGEGGNPFPLFAGGASISHPWAGEGVGRDSQPRVHRKPQGMPGRCSKPSSGCPLHCMASLQPLVLCASRRPLPAPQIPRLLAAQERRRVGAQMDWRLSDAWDTLTQA